MVDTLWPAVEAIAETMFPIDELTLCTSTNDVTELIRSKAWTVMAQGMTDHQQNSKQLLIAMAQQLRRGNYTQGHLEKESEGYKQIKRRVANTLSAEANGEIVFQPIDLIFPKIQRLFSSQLNWVITDLSMWQLLCAIADGILEAIAEVEQSQKEAFEKLKPKPLERLDWSGSVVQMVANNVEPEILMIFKALWELSDVMADFLENPKNQDNSYMRMLREQVCLWLTPAVWGEDLKAIIMQTWTTTAAYFINRIFYAESALPFIESSDGDALQAALSRTINTITAAGAQCDMEILSSEMPCVFDPEVMDLRGITDAHIYINQAYLVKDSLKLLQAAQKVAQENPGQQIVVGTHKLWCRFSWGLRKMSVLNADSLFSVNWRTR